MIVSGTELADERNCNVSSITAISCHVDLFSHITLIDTERHNFNLRQKNQQLHVDSEIAILTAKSSNL